MTVLVDIAAALICFSAAPDLPQKCHNALIGGDTPRGVFTLQRIPVEDPLYGGDALQFMETETEIFAIHRVWLGRPHERRLERLRSKNANVRRITKGCVNIAPSLFNELVQCCSTDILIVK